MEFNIRLPYPRPQLILHIKTTKITDNRNKLADLIRSEESINRAVEDRLRYQNKYFLT